MGEAFAATVMAFLALVFAMGGLGVAASIPDQTGVIHACYPKKGNDKGELRVVSSGRCGKTERALSFNQQGPQGEPGSDAQFNGVTAGGALDGTYPNPSLAAPEPVHLVGTAGEPPFQNGGNEAGLPPVGFYKDGLGRVHLQGTASSLGATQTLFSLPAGYVPTGQSCFSVPAFTPATVYTTNRICLIIGASAGGSPIADVRNESGTGTQFIDLSGISFRATQ
jgi:hypothetical protein